MLTIPAKVAERLAAGIKRFQPILASAKSRDVGESDTVMIVTDMLAEIFGYDKYSEVTSEFSIRGTYCDLAIKLGGKLEFLVEVKAIGADLKDTHTKQAIDYSVNQGTEWVLLTNGQVWRVYRVSFTKPVDFELVQEIDFAQVNPRQSSELECVYRLTKEGWAKSAIGEYHIQQQALNRFLLAAIVASDPVLDVVRRELRRVSPGVRIDEEQIKAVLMQEVLKREVVEGDKADEARRRFSRVAAKSLRARVPKDEETTTADPEGLRDK